MVRRINMKKLYSNIEIGATTDKERIIDEKEFFSYIDSDFNDLKESLDENQGTRPDEIARQISDSILKLPLTKYLTHL